MRLTAADATPHHCCSALRGCTGHVDCLLAWRALGVKRGTLYWEPQRLRPVWRTVASLSGATWMGALTVQMDKVILSKMVSLQQFGYYTIAAGIAMGVLQLIYPLVQAIL